MKTNSPDSYFEVGLVPSYASIEMYVGTKYLIPSAN